MKRFTVSVYDRVYFELNSRGQVGLWITYLSRPLRRPLRRLRDYFAGYSTIPQRGNKSTVLVCDVHWRSSESSGLRYKSRPSKKSIHSRSEGWWFQSTCAIKRERKSPCPFSAPDILRFHVSGSRFRVSGTGQGFRVSDTLVNLGDTT